MRIESSIRNSTVSILLQFITIGLSFVVRTIFIKVLGMDYLGVNGLFSNILTMLSLAELGVGTAIVYSMYRPMAENNQEKLCVLMKVYARIYKVIGITVIIIGLLMSIFLNSLIADKPNLPHLKLYFIIYVINSASSYFFIYKASIFTVAQREYIISLNKMLFTVLRHVLEIIILLITRNYILYLLVALITTIMGNIFISYKANKMYPFISQKSEGKLSREEKKEMTKNISALFFHRIGNVVVNGTDNIIISTILGVRIVGLYSNYLLIVNAINTFVNVLYNAITASIGNLNVTETKGKKYEVYRNVAFSNFWIGGFCAISLLTLLNPFITLWLGEEYLLSIPIVIMIVANSYLTIIRKTLLVFRNAMGLFWKDRYKPLFEAVINLVVSIFLVKRIGLIGVFLGTFISTITTSFWIEPYVLFKYGFGIKITKYFKMFAEYFFITIIGSLLTWVFSSIVVSNGITAFIYKVVICAIIPNIFFIICFYKKSEFKYFHNLLIIFIKRIGYLIENKLKTRGDYK